MEEKFDCAAGEKCQTGRREHARVRTAAEKSYFPAHAAPHHRTRRTRAAPAAVLVAAQLQGFCGGDRRGMRREFLCQGLCVLPIADRFRFALALLSPPVMSLFNTGLTPRDAEARANAPPLLFWSRALLRAAGCFVPARTRVPAGGSGRCPRGRRYSLLTYDGLFPFLLQLAPAPAATLTLLAVLTPAEHERRGQPQKGSLQGTLQPSKGR